MSLNYLNGSIYPQDLFQLQGEDVHFTPPIFSVHDIPAVEAQVVASSSALHDSPGIVVFMMPVNVILGFFSIFGSCIAYRFSRGQAKALTGGLNRDHCTSTRHPAPEPWLLRQT